MAVSHAKSKRKATGGRRRKYRNKKSFELGSLATNPLIDEKDVRERKRGMGGNHKVKVKRVSKANVLDTKTNKYQLVTIKTERENPANRNFPRRNILTKGALIETESGFARVTSRPAQHGVVNAVMVDWEDPKAKRREAARREAEEKEKRKAEKAAKKEAEKN